MDRRLQCETQGLVRQGGQRKDVDGQEGMRTLEMGNKEMDARDRPKGTHKMTRNRETFENRPHIYEREGKGLPSPGDSKFRPQRNLSKGPRVDQKNRDGKEKDELQKMRLGRNQRKDGTKDETRNGGRIPGNNGRNNPRPPGGEALHTSWCPTDRDPQSRPHLYTYLTLGYGSRQHFYHRDRAPSSSSRLLPPRDKRIQQHRL